MVPVLVRPHPLNSREQRVEQLPEGRTLADMVALFWPESARAYVLVFVGDREVAREFWPRVRPKAGAMVRMGLTLGGSAGGKQALGLIAIIAISIFAPYAGAALASTYGGSAGVWAVGVSMVGSLLVSALIKPPGIPVGDQAVSPAESATYSFQGQQNSATPYGPIPRVYGMHRLYPRLAAAPYAAAEAGDQYLYMLLDCGYGPLDIQELQIGDTSVENFRDLQYNIYPSWRAGDSLQLYSRAVTNESFNLALKAHIPEIRVTAPATARITCELACPRGLVLFDDRGNRTMTQVDWALGFRVLGSGSAFTPIDSVIASTSRPTTTFISLAPIVVFGQDQVLKSADMASWPAYLQRRVPGFAKGRTGFRHANLYGTAPNPQPDVGDTLYMAGDPYTVTAVAVPGTVNDADFQVTPGLLRDVPSQTMSCSHVRFLPTGGLNLTSDTAEPLFFSVSWDVPEGQYEVQAERLTDDSTNDRLVNDTAWLQLRSIANAPPIAPRDTHTIIEMKVRANEQLSGTLNNINCIATAILPVWDADAGDFVDQPTRNPAWAYLDVLRGQAAARAMGDERIDLDSLRAWAAYCDTPVANGMNPGVPEPRVFFDHVVDYSTTAFAMLQAIASAGRATPGVRDGRHGVIVDEEQVIPVQMFTPRNSWGFGATRAYMTEPDGLRVKFMDPITWQEGEVVIYASGFTSANAVNFEELKLLGVTRFSQATRDGNYLKAQALLRREEFTIQCDIENLIATRGDLVVVQHDVLQVGGDSSRLSAVAGATITLSEPFGNLPPGSYGVRLRLSDGTITAPIAATPVAPDKFTLASAPSPAPAVGDLASWGYINVETGEYLVKNIAPGTDLTATLTLCEIARGIYSADSGAIPPYVPPAGGRPQPTPVAVTNLRAVQLDKTIAREPYADVVLSWDAPPGAAYAHYAVYSITGGVQMQIAQTDVTSIQVLSNVRLLQPGLVTQLAFAVAGVDAAGVRSDAATVNIQLRDPLYVPDEPAFLSSNIHGPQTTLTWIAPTDPNNPGDGQIVTFEVRWLPLDSPLVVWTAATRVTDLIPWNVTTVTLPSRNGIYMVKAATASGVESAGAAETVTAVEDLLIKDVYDTISFDPAWIGRHDGTELDSLNRLTLQKGADGNYLPRGVFYSSVREAFDQVLQTRISSTMQAFGANHALFMDGWVPLSSARPLAMSIRGVDWNATLWVMARTTPYVMADWVPLAMAVPLELVPDIGDADWRPFIFGEYTGAALYFALVLESNRPTIGPVVVSAAVEIDFAERQENYSDIIVPAAGGLDFVFARPFVFPPSVAIDLQSAAPGDRVVRGPVGTAGLHVDVMNGGVAVPGTIDLSAFGVGRTF